MYLVCSLTDSCNDAVLVYVNSAAGNTDVQVCTHIPVSRTACTHMGNASHVVISHLRSIDHLNKKKHIASLMCPVAAKNLGRNVQGL